MFQRVIKQLKQMPGTPDRLERDEFDLFNGEAGSRSLVASYQAPKPLVLRQDRPVRVILTALDLDTATGDGASESFDLSNEVIEAPNSVDVVLYADGNKVPQSDFTVDYVNNSYSYTDDGTAQELAAFYIARDPVQFQIEKEAPRSQGGVNEIIFDEPTSLLHTRDQNEQPRFFDVGDSPLHPVVPENWKVNVYADPDGAYGPAFDDSRNDTFAVNAILSLPYKQGAGSIDGLGKAVAHDIVDRS
ncbi:hypothetical protein JZX76_11505 [Haloarcula hispanica]|uniref:Uncharacterized protein n=1 Tax=Haloarcula hispanica TaxID=51589 RepID=A0A482T823_HALHI|nr:hypothetical protein [Haloarcula hispanica]MCJ0620113.1 hypothetical protein [Haloarcula hispanica]RYJ10542.1 hypothetical protein ELS20_11425 [Haloarcula hispanica]